MAAQSLQSSQYVWAKVKLALANASPAAQEAFRALKISFNNVKNPDLQFASWGAADAIAATGAALPTGAFTLYGFYGKKTGTGSTQSFLEIHNKNTITGSTDVLASLGFKAVSDERFLVAPPQAGLLFSSVSGAAAVSVTAIGGATVSTGASDSVPGFVIIGA